MVLRTGLLVPDSCVPWYCGHLWNTLRIEKTIIHGEADRAITEVLWCPVPLNLIARSVRWAWSFVRHPMLLTNNRADYWEAKYKGLAADIKCIKESPDGTFVPMTRILDAVAISKSETRTE